MKKKNFLSGILVGVFLGFLMGYFVCGFANELRTITIEKSNSEFNVEKPIDWSKHPNKHKRNYLENIYLNSSKNYKHEKYQ